MCTFCAAISSCTRPAQGIHILSCTLLRFIHVFSRFFIVSSLLVYIPAVFAKLHVIAAGDSGKGVSFSSNTALANISFGTLHVYPQAFGVNFSSSGDTDNYTWVNDYFIQPRALTAHRLGKPLIIEEFGLTPDYGVPNNVTRARSAINQSIILMSWGPDRWPTTIKAYSEISNNTV